MGEKEKEHKVSLTPKERQIDRKEIVINGKSKVYWRRSLNKTDAFRLF
jgi:hypothetical protein